jgi:hypothetical protein
VIARRLKLDQNVPERVATQLRELGHDACTVREQELAGTSDANRYRVCQAERRILVTFDIDFADLRTYPPESGCGTIVLRPSVQAARHVAQLVYLLAQTLAVSDPRGQLWIVEDDRMRVRGLDTE